MIKTFSATRSYTTTFIEGNIEIFPHQEEAHSFSAAMKNFPLPRQITNAMNNEAHEVH